MTLELKNFTNSTGAANIQSLIYYFRASVSSLRRVDSVGASKTLQQSISGKGGGGKILSSYGEGFSKRLYTFCGFLALELIVAFLLFCNPGIFGLYQCQKSETPGLHYPPSGWYYEHVYEHPLPMLRILSAEDGAPPFRSRILSREREITIATHTTADRLPAVKMTALRWSGTMALVVLVRVRSEIAPVYRTLQEIHGEVEAEGRCRLSIQMIIEDGEFKDDEEALRARYPINAMRNLALRMVTTELVFMIDADLVPSPGLHEHLTQHEDKYGSYLQRATERKQVLVVPAFEMIQDKSISFRESIHALPHTKEEMREAWWNGILDCFQCDVSPIAHTRTDYPRFTDPAVDYPYDVHYEEGYEPFFIAAMNNFPEYDARFRGYGKNKVSHVQTLAAQGMSFAVVPEGFLVELPHLPSLSQRAYSGPDRDPLEKWRIDALYRHFKAELNKKSDVPDEPDEPDKPSRTYTTAS